MGHPCLKTASPIIGVGRTGLVHAKKVKLDHFLTPCTRMNAKWIKVLNIYHDTIKILEENAGSKISDISGSNTFANIYSTAREIKEK